MLRLVLLLALVVPGCKSMGGLASGLGHVASATAHVAAPLARASATVARATLPVAKAALPIAADIASGMVNISAGGTTFGNDPDPAEPVAVTSMDGPLIDNHDVCNACPDNLTCGECLGANNHACGWSAPGAYSRCSAQ